MPDLSGAGKWQKGKSRGNPKEYQRWLLMMTAEQGPEGRSEVSCVGMRKGKHKDPEAGMCLRTGEELLLPWY